MNNAARYRAELSNRCVRGRAMGNTYLVVDGGPDGRHSAILASYPENKAARDQHLHALQSGAASSVLDRLI